MKKKMFYGFSLFVFLFMIAIWPIASAELAELQSETEYVDQQPATEVVSLPK